MEQEIRRWRYLTKTPSGDIYIDNGEPFIGTKHEADVFAQAVMRNFQPYLDEVVVEDQGPVIFN